LHGPNTTHGAIGRFTRSRISICFRAGAYSRSTKALHQKKQATRKQRQMTASELQIGFAGLPIDPKVIMIPSGFRVKTIQNESKTMFTCG
jgi:hypothetical protein